MSDKAGKAVKSFLTLFLFFAALNWAASLAAAPLGVATLGADVLTPFTGAIRPYSAPVTPEIAAARAGIAPHHGLASETIARFYNSFPGDAELVILLGPDHFYAGRRAVSLCPMPWRVNGRENKILESDGRAVDFLSRTGAVEAASAPFRLEHSIGLHVDFIARRFPNTKIAALTVKNSATYHELYKLVPALSELLAKEGTLMILSMDFSHEKMPSEARREDDRSVEHILSFGTQNLRGLDIDAPAATWLFLETLKELGIKRGRVIERTNSSEIIGHPDMLCTSYATVVFCSDEYK